MAKVVKKIGRAIKKPISKLFGGGSGSSPAADTTAITEQRLADEAKNRGRTSVNLLFNDPEKKAAREAMYTQQRDAAFNLNKGFLDEDTGRQRQQQRFAALERGVLGGSNDIEQQSDIDRVYRQGVLDIGTRADQMRNDWRGNDEATRLNLLSMIDSGTDETTAIDSGLRQLDAARSRAAGDSMGRFIGNLFGDAGATYDRWRERQGADDATGRIYSMGGQQPQQRRLSIFNWGR
jgi:hypothetical protein